MTTAIDYMCLRSTDGEAISNAIDMSLLGHYLFYLNIIIGASLNNIINITLNSLIYTQYLHITPLKANCYVIFLQKHPLLKAYPQVVLSKSSYYHYYYLQLINIHNITMKSIIHIASILP